MSERKAPGPTYLPLTPCQAHADHGMRLRRTPVHCETLFILSEKATTPATHQLEASLFLKAKLIGKSLKACGHYYII